MFKRGKQIVETAQDARTGRARANGPKRAGHKHGARDRGLRGCLAHILSNVSMVPLQVVLQD